jgi:hypothetical protein
LLNTFFLGNALYIFTGQTERLNDTIMKNALNQKSKQVQFATAGKKRYIHYYAFQKKNTIIRYIEIIGVIAIALIVIGAISGYFN